MALVKRALKVLADREVSPQLGLLKSTLLQLDSSFSERDYGVGSFRDFADKLAQQGIVTLKHQGRSTLVELNDGENAAVEAPRRRPTPTLVTDSSSEAISASREAGRRAARELLEQPDSGPGAAEIDEDKETRPAPTEPASLGDGVALVRRLLAEAATPPRWPMYPRQFKQFLKAAQPDFDERRYGSIADLMRACQKDGILRLERDRQGGLRVFANGATARATVPHGWGLVVNNAPAPVETDRPGGAGRAVAASRLPEPVAMPLEVEPVVAVAAKPAAKAKKAPRAKKTAAPAAKAEKKPAPRKKKAGA